MDVEVFKYLPTIFALLTVAGCWLVKTPKEDMQEIRAEQKEFRRSLESLGEAHHGTRRDVVDIKRQVDNLAALIGALSGEMRTYFGTRPR